MRAQIVLNAWIQTTLYHIIDILFYEIVFSVREASHSDPGRFHNLQTISALQLESFIKARKERIESDCTDTTGRNQSDKSAAIFNIFVSPKFRKGPWSVNQIQELRQRYLPSIHKRVNAGLPIQVTLFGAPFKSKNPLKNQSRTLPDLAEVMFILQLYTLYRTVKSVYEPGVEIHLIHDGVYYAAPCDIPASDAAAYREYFANLLKLSPDFEDCIKTHELTELIAKTGIDQEAYFNLAADMANQWLTSPDANHEVSTAYKRAICSMCPLKIQRDRFASAVNQYLKERRVEDSEIHRLVLNAVYEYKKRQIVVYDLKDPRDVFFPDAIHASASNHKDKLPMWLVQRDKSLLPWHGRGVVRADLSLRIYYEQDITANAQYRPIFLEGEETPFMYSAAPMEKLIVS